MEAEVECRTLMGMQSVMSVVVTEQVYSLGKGVCPVRRTADECSLESFVEEGRNVLE